MKWFDGSTIRLMLIVVVVAIVVAVAAGKTKDGETDSTVITAAGPRLGPIVVVEVTFPNRDALDELARAGYDISSVQGDVAEIYATEEELGQLKEASYDYHEIERQPLAQDISIMALGGYHNYDNLTTELNAYAEIYPDICRLYSLGQSVEGRELWAMIISDYPDDEEDEPEFKYVSTMHGNEPLGTEMCLYFIDLLLNEYGTDKRITNLVDSTDIWIVPLINPDGLELGTRYNAEGFDLNRNFPVTTDSSKNIFEGGSLYDAECQPEIQHIVKWAAENSFVLSANLHTGGLYVRYPYDDNGRGGADSPTPDDQLFEEISRCYSMWNLPMWNSTRYPQGIVNGAYDYPVNGGTIDWHYRYVSCNEVAIELSNIKRPSASQIPIFWLDNKESMLSFLEAVHIGVRGVVTDLASGKPLWAEVWVGDNSHPVFTDPDVGDYHRMLLPGTYELTFSAPGYESRSIKNVTVTDGSAIRLDVKLVPGQGFPDFNRDEKVDTKDFCKLAQYWLSDESSVDIAPLPNGDGIVDFQDMAVLAEYWLIDFAL